MKKSNALMLSYMIFLSISLVAHIFCSWSGLDRISMAATIAGCFFAFADLANWSGTRWIPKLEALQKSVDEFPTFVQAHITYYEAKKQEVQQIIDMAEPYSVKYEPIANIVNSNTAHIKKLEENIQKANLTQKETVEQANEALDIARKEIKKCGMVEMLLMICGFVSFFMIITFDWFVAKLYNHQSFATTLAFIIIMLTYYLREILDEKAKKEVNEILEEQEHNKQEVEHLVAKSKLTPALDSFRETISKLSEHEKMMEAE